LAALAGASYFLWRGIVHGLRRGRLVVRGVTLTGEMARSWGFISIWYSTLFLLAGAICVWGVVDEVRRSFSTP